MMFFMVVEGSEAEAKKTAEALAEESNTSVEALMQRTVVGTPDVRSRRG